MAAILKLDKPMQQITTLLRGKTPDSNFDNFTLNDALNFRMQTAAVNGSASPSNVLIACAAAHIYARHGQHDIAEQCYATAAHILLNGHNYKFWLKAKRMQAKALEATGNSKQASEIEATANRYISFIQTAKQARKSQDYGRAFDYYQQAHGLLPKQEEVERSYLEERMEAMSAKLGSAPISEQASQQPSSSLDLQLLAHDDEDETPEERALRLKAQDINFKCQHDLGFYAQYTNSTSATAPRRRNHRRNMRR